MSAERTVNVKRISHWESEISDEGFVVKLLAFNGDDNRYAVNLHFEWWALPFLARELWKVLTRRRTKVEGEMAAAVTALNKPEG